MCVARIKAGCGEATEVEGGRWGTRRRCRLNEGGRCRDHRRRAPRWATQCVWPVSPPPNKLKRCSFCLNEKERLSVLNRSCPHPERAALDVCASSEPRTWVRRQLLRTLPPFRKRALCCEKRFGLDMTRGGQVGLVTSHNTPGGQVGLVTTRAAAKSVTLVTTRADAPRPNRSAGPFALWCLLPLVGPCSTAWCAD